jgi:hypothetical protein
MAPPGSATTRGRKRGSIYVALAVVGVVVAIVTTRWFLGDAGYDDCLGVLCIFGSTTYSSSAPDGDGDRSQYPSRGTREGEGEGKGGHIQGYNTVIQSAERGEVGAGADGADGRGPSSSSRSDDATTTVTAVVSTPTAGEFVTADVLKAAAAVIVPTESQSPSSPPSPPAMSPLPAVGTTVGGAGSEVEMEAEEKTEAKAKAKAEAEADAGGRKDGKGGDEGEGASRDEKQEGTWDVAAVTSDATAFNNSRGASSPTAARSGDSGDGGDRSLNPKLWTLP